jgi:parallel beta-helix repeat protein
MKLLAIFIPLAIPGLCFATNYFVSGTGANTNNGLSVNTAFLTLQTAADLTKPGDTVFVLNGTYVNPDQSTNILDVYTSGEPNKPIVYTRYAGNNPIIKLGGNNWQGITLQGADYIVIDGFTIVGNSAAVTLAYAQTEKNNTNNPITSNNGIAVARSYFDSNNRAHHNIVRNCTVSNCGGGGIYTYQADYTTIENNTVFNCGWWSPYGNSGISMYQNWNSDEFKGIKNFLTGNTTYRNENFIPFFVAGSITDGNGIIIDDSRNTQNESTLGVYKAFTYIANNLVFDNGGRGIHVYSSDNVYIVNNTCYKNCQTPAFKDGEFTAYDASEIYFYNNIALPSEETPPLGSSDNPTAIVVSDHNLWAANAAKASPAGTNIFTGSPDFVLPSADAARANFHLNAGSAAINKGTRLYAPGKDKDDIIRSGADSIDIGAYEFVPIVKGGPRKIVVYPNPTRGKLFIRIDQKVNIAVEVLVYAVNGALCKKEKLFFQNGMGILPVNALRVGEYILKIRFDAGDDYTTRFLKLQ